MYYKLLSDIDGLNVEWEDCYGRHWESFTNYDDLDKAVKENQAFNDTISEIIERDKFAYSIYLAKSDLNYYYIDHLAPGEKIEIAKCEKAMKLDYNPKEVIKHVLKEYIAINKKIIKASVCKPATNTLQDFFV